MASPEGKETCSYVSNCAVSVTTAAGKKREKLDFRWLASNKQHCYPLILKNLCNTTEKKAETALGLVTYGSFVSVSALA